MTPFPFLLLGALHGPATRSRRVAPAIGAWLLSAVLSAAVEFGQTCFPPAAIRHFNDPIRRAVIAGAAIGAIAWIVAWGESNWRFAWWKPQERQRYGPGQHGVADPWPYAAGLFVRKGPCPST
jgi:hypothetical protein